MEPSSEERYRNLFDLAPDPFAILQDGCLVYVNRVAATMLGRDASEVAGQPIERFIHPDDLARSAERRAILLRTGQPTPLHDLRLVRPDGSVSLVETCSGLCEFNGRPAIQLTARDVTARRQHEDALRESEARLAEAQELGRVGSFDIDIDTGIASASPALCRMFGFENDEPFRDIEAFTQRYVHPDDRAHVRQSRDRMPTDGSVDSVDYRFLHPDGSLRVVQVRRRMASSHGGRVRRILGTVQDITERKEAEQALRRSEEALRRAQQIAQVGSWSFDLATNGILASAEMRRLCDLHGDGPWQPADILPLIHPGDRERCLEAWRRAIEAEPLEFEHRLVVRGQTRWTYTVTAIERNADGRPTLVTGITQDITSRRRLEQEFQQAQKMEAVGKLAGGVAHDFNNMLTVINGYTDMLLADLDPDDPRRDRITQVREAGERAAGLTRQLLAFGRKQILAPRLVTLNDIVRRAEVLLRRLIGEDVTVFVDLEPNLAQLEADPSQLEQVLLNLAVNARDAMPLGGSLTVATRTITVPPRRHHTAGDILPGRYVELRVSDTGSGMSAEIHGKIFEPFFTTKPTGSGTGLGLSTVYGIVKQSGGHISVESALGAGATFRILLPAVPDDVAAEPAPPAVHSRRGTETILVVEDEDAVRRVARLALEKHGYLVIEATSGDEARRVAAQHSGPIHLVVTDVVMAGMSGRDVADLLRAVRPEIRVLFMSGYTDDAVVRHGVLDATDHFLQKPFTPASLATTVRAVLDR